MQSRLLMLECRAMCTADCLLQKQQVCGAQLHWRYLRENTGCGVVCLNYDMLVELSGVHAKGGVESISLVVIEVHGDVDRQAEELAPLAGLPVIGHGWLCLQDCSEEITMPA